MPTLIHEGYLKWLPPSLRSPGGTPKIVNNENEYNNYHVVNDSKFIEKYCELYGKKLIMYNDKSKKEQTGNYDIQGFCQWHGENGFLDLITKEYGIELKIKQKQQDNTFDSIYIVTYNRMDLENWSRAFMAALDPSCLAAKDLLRQRKYKKKKEKEKIKLLQEQQRIMDEKERLLSEEENKKIQEREKQVENMTPLERSDGLGILDEETIKILENRKLRRQQRQLPSTERINRMAYRKLLNDTAGGKIENFKPLPKKVIENYQKPKLVPPPPKQFFEAVSSSARSERKNNNSKYNMKNHSSNGSINHQNGVDEGLDDDDEDDDESFSGSSSSYSNGIDDDVNPSVPLPSHTLSTSNHVSSMLETNSLSKSPLNPPPPPPLDITYGSIRESKINSLNNKAIKKSSLIKNDNHNDVNNHRKGLFDSDSESEDEVKSEIKKNIQKTQNLTDNVHLSKQVDHISLSNKSKSNESLTDTNSSANHFKTDDITISKTDSNINYLKKMSSNSSIRSESTIYSTFQETNVSTRNSNRNLSFRSNLSDMAKVEFLFYNILNGANNEKNVVYTFQLQRGDFFSKFSLSYMEMEKIHNTLIDDLKNKKINLPKYPSNHWYKNYTKPENIKKRANELLCYFNSLIRIPEIQNNTIFHSEYKLTSDFIKAVQL